MDAEYRLGAENALALARQTQPDLIVLQSRSPSCGVKQIYDGSFGGVRIPGQGVTAALLGRAGFKLMDIEDLPED